MRAIGYVRVSTEKQAGVGVSLDAQTEKVRAMAVVQGADLVDVLIDAGESARSLHRPGMSRLLALVDEGAVDTVIIAKLDRLTRSVVDLAELLKRFERRGVSLVSVADSLDTRSASGRLVLNIMVSVSQWEREAIGERTRDAMRHKRANGERVGTVPFGYRPAAEGVRLEADDVEQGILAHPQAEGQGADHPPDRGRPEPARAEDAAGHRVALPVRCAHAPIRSRLPRTAGGRLTLISTERRSVAFGRPGRHNVANGLGWAAANTGVGWLRGWAMSRLCAEGDMGVGTASVLPPRAAIRKIGRHSDLAPLRVAHAAGLPLMASDLN